MDWKIEFITDMRYFIYHWSASDNNMKHTHQLEDELTDNIDEGIYIEWLNQEKIQ